MASIEHKQTLSSFVLKDEKSFPEIYVLKSLIEKKLNQNLQVPIIRKNFAEFFDGQETKDKPEMFEEETTMNSVYSKQMLNLLTTKISQSESEKSHTEKLSRRQHLKSLEKWLRRTKKLEDEKQVISQFKIKIAVNNYDNSMSKDEYGRYPVKKLQILKDRAVDQIPEITEKVSKFIRIDPHTLDINPRSDLVDEHANTIWKLKDLQKVLGLFLVFYKDFNAIHRNFPAKKVHEIIFVFDILTRPLKFKSLHKFVMEKPLNSRKELVRSLVQKIFEKLLFYMRNLLVKYYGAECTIQNKEWFVSTRDLIKTFAEWKDDSKPLE